MLSRIEGVDAVAGLYLSSLLAPKVKLVLTCNGIGAAFVVLGYGSCAIGLGDMCKRLGSVVGFDNFGTNEGL